MRASIQFFEHTSCHVEWENTSVWFNPPLSCLVDTQTTSAPTSDWCLLTHTDQVHVKALAVWASHRPDTRFAAPIYIATLLASAGLPIVKIYALDSDPVDLNPGLRLRTVKNCKGTSSEENRDLSCVLQSNAGNLLLTSVNNGSVPDLEALLAIGPVHTAFFPICDSNSQSVTEVNHTLSSRLAFQWAKTLKVKQLVTTSSHTATHGLYPEELRLVHQRMGCVFNLLLSPSKINIGPTKVSVVIRTLNEAQYLSELLEGISSQETEGMECEVVLVDSGSTDKTLSIAEHYGCRILHIKRKDFSFGRSLNMGCEAATGSILVITSGHCVPADRHWLQTLCAPLLQGTAQYSYGKQLGGSNSHFSEHRVFEKYFPACSQVPQPGYYCNNANSALLKSAWVRYRFNEELTGLEDMELAQRLCKDGGLVGYVAEARVYHHHSESWAQVRLRFEREAIALQQIMPNVHITLLDALRYIASSIWKDCRHAYKEGVLTRKAKEVIHYRYYQYVGSYRGNHEHRKLSRSERDKYFYPH